MQKNNSKSARVHRHSSWKLIFDDLKDELFFNPIYTCYSEGDDEEGYIKLKYLEIDASVPPD